MSVDMRVAPAPEEAPFWEWCRRGELRLQRCAGCGAWRHPPRPRCPLCRSDQATWDAASGRGTIFTWTICHPPVLPVFADRVPYTAVVVELAEGPLMVGLLTGPGSDAPEVGQPVQVTFERLGPELVVPWWRRSEAGQ